MGFTLNDLRGLAINLPPSERVALGEVTDVLSAVVAHLIHGDGVIEAARDGGAVALYDFYHDHAVQIAKDAGEPEPARGAPVEAVQASRAGPASTVTPSELAAVQRQLDQVLAALQATQAGAQPQPAPETTGPAPSPSDASAPPTSPAPAPTDVEPDADDVPPDAPTPTEAHASPAPSITPAPGPVEPQPPAPDQPASDPSVPPSTAPGA